MHCHDFYKSGRSVNKFAGELTFRLRFVLDLKSDYWNMNSRFLGDEAARARGFIGGISRACDSRAIMARVKYRKEREKEREREMILKKTKPQSIFNIYIYICIYIYIYIRRPWQKRKRI